MKKDDYVVLKHIISLIPQLDLSDNNNYIYCAFPYVKSLSVYAVDDKTYVGYNEAGAIIFSSKNMLWSKSLLEPMSNYGNKAIEIKIMTKMEEELTGFYLVKLDKYKRNAFMRLIECYRDARKEEEEVEHVDNLSKQMLDHIKGGNKND